jgi:diacylglycerol kinase (ATP)
MVSFATGPIERLVYVWQLRNAYHDKREDVITLRARQVTVSGEDFFLSADGEISGPERRRSWHLEQAAYSMIVPAD